MSCSEEISVDEVHARSAEGAVLGLQRGDVASLRRAVAARLGAAALLRARFPSDRVGC
jgi:hypothetical protein